MRADGAHLEFVSVQESALGVACCTFRGREVDVVSGYKHVRLAHCGDTAMMQMAVMLHDTGAQSTVTLWGGGA